MALSFFGGKSKEEKKARKQKERREQEILRLQKQDILQKEICEAKAISGDIESCYEYAKLMEQGNSVVIPSYEEAIVFYKTAIEKGDHALAKLNLAKLYWQGKNSSLPHFKQKTFALQWFRELIANQDLDEAKIELIKLYVNKDPFIFSKQEVEWSIVPMCEPFEEAAIKSNVFCVKAEASKLEITYKDNLDNIQYHRIDIECLPKEISFVFSEGSFLELFTDKKIQARQLLLNYLLAGVQKGVFSAGNIFDWCNDLIKKANPFGAFALALFYERGGDCPCRKDLEKASELYKQAMELGYESAVKPYENISRVLVTKQIELEAKYGINPKDIEYISSLGEGSFGTVWLANFNGKKVAVKKIKDYDAISAAGKMKFEIDKFKHEVAFMCQFSECENIIKIFGAVFESDQYAIVMEYMPHGDLYDLLRTKNLQWSAKLMLAIDIAAGLAYLHSRNFMHRDLKTKNVLVNEVSLGNWHAKITDFGEGKEFSNCQVTYQTRANCIGTFPYLAPEILKLFNSMDVKVTTVIYTSAVDIFALGRLFWEMATHKMPFEEEMDQFEIVRKVCQNPENAALPLPKNCVPSFASLTSRCGLMCPAGRPTAQEVVEILKQKCIPEAVSM